MARPWTNPASRFSSRIDKTADCWNWTGELIYSGYGRLSIGKKHVLAHRLSWMIHNGNIPDDLSVCHSCNNRRCVRPEHLYLATHQENIKYAVDCRSFSGEKHSRRKLTESKVREIRVHLASGTVTKQSLAKRYGVSATVIRHVGERKIWKHVQDEQRSVSNS